MNLTNLSLLYRFRIAPPLMFDDATSIDVWRRRAASVHPVDQRRRHRDRVLQQAARADRTAQWTSELKIKEN